MHQKIITSTDYMYVIVCDTSSVTLWALLDKQNFWTLCKYVQARVNNLHFLEIRDGELNHLWNSYCLFQL